jgi:hypothetical protein
MIDALNAGERPPDRNLVGNVKFGSRGGGVCTENFIRINWLEESGNVNASCSHCSASLCPS